MGVEFGTLPPEPLDPPRFDVPPFDPPFPGATGVGEGGEVGVTVGRGDGVTLGRGVWLAVGAGVWVAFASGFGASATHAARLKVTKIPMTDKDHTRLDFTSSVWHDPKTRPDGEPGEISLSASRSEHSWVVKRGGGIAASECR
ncbi:hypothetical protein FHX49_000483 [Microbacterium endophyticum]|uniref:Uncharacterized protein n=1 Tax=Microbacterium endophyticum TaxID=1526412 RepID=A0A7W4V151_9MICO|nr:hypothetical protein [Microbacterium endophyticum]MBB2974942.1 hypothetical protein [Microbacterium endophyticum]NIK37239.1 hypothetical protein [Microbacterium endophyticum]